MATLRGRRRLRLDDGGPLDAGGPGVGVHRLRGRRRLLAVADLERRHVEALFDLDDLERAGELGRGRRPPVRVLVHALEQQAPQRVRHVATLEGGGPGPPDAVDEVDAAVRSPRNLERRSAGQQGVQRRGQRVDVRALVGQPRTRNHLGRRPRDRHALRFELALVGSGVLTLFDVAGYTNDDLHLTYSWTRTFATDFGAAALAVFVGTLFTLQGRRTGLFRLAGIGLVVCAVAGVATRFLPGALLFVELASQFTTICLFTLASFGHGRTQGTLALTSFVVVATVLNFLAPLVTRALPPFVTVGVCALGAAAIAVFYFVSGNATEERAGFDLTS